MGEDHPETLTATNNLAMAYQLFGQVDRAIALHEKVLKARQAKLGEGHADTISSQMNLARSLQKAQRYQDAELLLRRTVESAGRGQPRTIASIPNPWPSSVAA